MSRLNYGNSDNNTFRTIVAWLNLFSAALVYLRMHVITKGTPAKVNSNVLNSVSITTQLNSKIFLKELK